MNAEAAADTAVLVSAILMLLAITSKLVTASLVTRSKAAYTKLDARRREIVAKVKEVQLKRTSARGTLEFWNRRRTETSQKVQEAIRDLESYEAQFGSEELDEDEGAAMGMDVELLEAPEDSAGDATVRAEAALTTDGEEEADSAGETDSEPGPDPQAGEDGNDDAESSGAASR